MKVHAEILRMARTREKRERIKWIHAQGVFFSRDTFSLECGLMLANQCDHEDARFFVTLFPNGPPGRPEQAADVFLTRTDDARCLCWAAASGAQPKHNLLHRSAEGGCAWAQAMLAKLLGEGRERLAWTEKAAAQGEPSAMALLAGVLWDGLDDVVGEDKKRALQLWREAAELGERSAFVHVAIRGCDNDSVEQCVWLRRAAVWAGNGMAQRRLLQSAGEQLRRYDEEGESGRKVFEIGAAVALVRVWSLESREPGDKPLAQRAGRLYQQWSGETKRAIACWLWLARHLGVARDIRVTVANLVWDERAVWSD